MSHGRAPDPVDLGIAGGDHSVAAVGTRLENILPAPILQPLADDPDLLLLRGGTGGAG
jgi:hypothetical protein